MKCLKTGVIVLTAAGIITAAAGLFAQTASPSPSPVRQGVIDSNGDGICDLTGRVIGSGQGTGLQSGNGQRKGPGDGSGGQYGKQTGKRGGNGSAGGNCDGTGRSSGGRRGNRGGRR